MASHFVSGGTIGPSGEAASHNDADGGSEPRATPLAAAKRKSEWEAVQLELEAERKRRDEARLKAATGGEKSLYDILQANKGSSFFVSCPSRKIGGGGRTWEMVRPKGRDRHGADAAAFLTSGQAGGL